MARGAAVAQRDALLSRRVPETLLGFIRLSSAWHQLWLLMVSTLVFLMSTAPHEVQRRLSARDPRRGVRAARRRARFVINSILSAVVA